ncbi:protein kinase family protein [Phycicoccus sp. Soil748]|uniref:protein kinase family protein n=1 Tax=Phycicoccus sp. Soil748 TaxID=1736397 RepID=UPI000ABDFDFB|nr:protein kinase family protein [Phycicoccus sp. Soil748]
MHGVGPSTVLGGRYAVQRRLEQLPRAERWSAHDLTLERDVVVVCFGEDEGHAAATLDAARRAAGLDNHRLVRVLDVGRSEGISFFVEEAIPEAHTLAQVLEQGGLPAEEARRIAGESATGLEAARARGLHHLRLTPHSVLRASDGTIKVRGVATAAAMASEEDVPSAEAARLDAVGVVAITYAALTSRWPLPGAVPGLEQAPHVVGGVPAPSEIAAGVPGDLDALCRLTLNDDQGPLTPGDFAAQIAPWAPTQVVGLGGSAPREADDGLARTVALPVAGLERSGLRPDRGDSQASPSTAAAGAAAGAGAPYDQATQVVPAPGGAPGPGHPTPGTAQPGEEHAEGGAGAGAAATAAAVGTAIGAAGHAAGHAAGAAAHRVGSFAKAAADKAAERRAAREAAERRAEQHRISLDEAFVDGADPLDPPLPMLPPETAEAPTRDQSKIVLAIMAAFLVIVTVFGFWGASRIGSKSNFGLGTNTPRNTVTVTAPTATVAPSSGTSSPSSSGSAGEPFAILSATGFDPEGDNAERNSEAPRVFDGKPDTFWSSEGYASANLGGLKKGVGVRVDLGQVHKISEVDLVLPDVSDVTVFVGQDRTRDNTTVIGTSQGKKGEISLKADKPVDGQYVFVWFTSVSKVSDGRFRATLAEVTVR